MSATPADTIVDPPAPAPSDWTLRSSYTLGFLCLISVFNYLDRSILGLALPTIKVEMQASDTALGLVSGLAFVLFYAILGVPIAWAADRWSRRNIIAGGPRLLEPDDGAHRASSPISGSWRWRAS